MQDKEFVDETNNLPIAQEPTNTSELTIAAASTALNQESLEILEKLVGEADQEKAKDLTYLFNMNQNKKTMVRMDKLSGLQDNLVDQFVQRIALRPDEISNKELLDGIKIVQDILERGQRQVSEADQAPLIQINQQTNSLQIGESSTELDRESRERVKNAVFCLLKNINTPDQQVIDYEDKTETLEEAESTDDI